MLHNVNKIALHLNKHNISTSVIDIYRIKPLNKRKLKKILLTKKAVVTIEEQHIDGGIGSQLCEIIAEEKINISIKRFGIKDKYSKFYCDRDWLQKFYEIDYKSVSKKIILWIKILKNKQKWI